MTTKKVVRMGRWAAAVLAALLTWGCAAINPEQRPAAPTAEKPEMETEAAQRGWWYVRFIREYPEDSSQEPAWYMDLLIANEIVAPVLYRHEADLPLWRFHRRAVNDSSGHALSFIIYATPWTAEAVYADIRSTLLLDELLSAGKVDRVTYEETAEIKRPERKDVSDDNWPLEVQNAWPYFIMGVSRTWLDLVSLEAEKLGRSETPDRLPELESLYRQVNDAVDELWRQEGRHAFLHHLNAVFGYQPLVIYERKLLTF